MEALIETKEGIKSVGDLNYPIVEIEGIEITENDYVRSDARWNCLKLIEHSKKYPVFDFPLAGMDLGRDAWGGQLTMDDFVYHMKRIEKTNLEYPILLDDRGTICDGWHRICKALLKGDTAIKAIRLVTMPEADQYFKAGG